MDEGVIYVATGADYLELAVASAESLRAVAPGLAVDLFTDQPLAPGLFDRVYAVEHVHDRAKLECMARSRFERTLYLDCDTLVVGDPAPGFGVLARFDLAVAHEVRRAWGLIHEGLGETTPSAFPQLNSGVVFYRMNDAVRAFLQDWARRYHASGQGRDQVVLKDMLWRGDHGVRFWVLPPEYNLRRLTLLDAWEPLDARVKIIHSHRLLDHLRHPGAQRITTLAGVLEAERRALAGEWDELGIGGADRRLWLVDGPEG